ncbi:hypothetical protein ACN38_g5415 [Penicillium nordicum]|uniref:Uncharacterized protein n=1 Tax=Penicillium nordicum TaxID=229535 RepID=A0A0M8PAC5_9EURO|nr:hypothetical protein ACN38_g5415 [Penicillium nordicum]
MQEHSLRCVYHVPQYANDIWQPAFIALFLNIFTSLKPCTVSVGSCVSIRLWALKYRLCLSSLSRPVYPCEAFYIGRANAETRRVDSIIWMFEFPRWGLAFRLTKRPVRGELQNLIEELGFPPSEHQFLLRLFGSSDPFSWLPGADLETSHSRNQSGQNSSTSIARRLTSARLCERANQLRLRSEHRHPSDSREGLEGRDRVHYEEEWTSLIGTDSESLLSELLQQLATDDEPPSPEHPKASENVAHPGSFAPPSPSVYGSEIVRSNLRLVFLGFPDSLKIWETVARSENNILPASVPRLIHLHSTPVGSTPVG